MPILPFITDKKLDFAIQHVANALDKAKENKVKTLSSLDKDKIFESPLFSNSIDPFAMKFGLSFYGDEKWLEMEINRQLYKTFEQKIGEFHQMVLGSVNGWIDLKTGDKSKVDLKREDNSIFIELKNKFNTCNSGSLNDVEKKLIEALKNHPNAKAYWAFIIPGVKEKNGREHWTKGRGTSRIVRNERLYKIWGTDVYKLVTGDGNNLFRLYKILDSAITSFTKDKDSLLTISDEIVKESIPHLSSIKSQIFEKMLVSALPETGRSEDDPMI